MIYKSADGRLEVSVSDQVNAAGYFIVASKQLKEDNIWAEITIHFGGMGNETRIESKTQDPGKKEWPVRGSHRGDVVRNVMISTMLELS